MLPSIFELTNCPERTERRRAEEAIGKKQQYDSSNTRREGGRPEIENRLPLTFVGVVVVDVGGGGGGGGDVAVK